MPTLVDFNVSGVFDSFWQLTLDGLSSGAIYALVAVGYTLAYGVARLINFAHSEIFMLGMFGQYVALLLLGFRPSGTSYDMGVVVTLAYLAVAMLVGMAVAGTAAVGLERVAYRPLRKRGANRLTFLIAAVGMSFVLQEFVHFILPQLWPSLGGPNAEQPIRLVQQTEQIGIFSGSLSNLTIIVVVVAVGLTAATDVLLNRTKLGRGIRALAQDPKAAALMGVSQDRVIMITFLMSGVLAGAAALLYTIKIPSAIIYSGGFLLGIKAFTAAVLGGIGNVRGALLGGFLLGILEMYGQVLLGTEWRDVVAFVVLISVLMFRPTGIMAESLGRARV